MIHQQMNDLNYMMELHKAESSLLVQMRTGKIGLYVPSYSNARSQMR
jgi:hypothetical protein